MGFTLNGITSHHATQDVRRDLHSPSLAVCVGLSGFGGWRASAAARALVAAQLHATCPRRHPELGGRVRAEETRDYWREQEASIGR